MTRRLVLVISGCVAALLAACAGVSGANDPSRETAGPVAARVVKVRDGDTMEVEAYVWPQQTVRTAVRLRGIDAPELRAGCEREREAAEAARERLAVLIGDGRIALSDVSGDKYFGRVLARVSTTNRPDLGAALVAEGLVAPYDGGRRGNWCAGVPTLSTFRPRG